MPTFAPRKSPSPAHICTATESIPRRHLRHHCCPPGQLPLRNTCATQRNVLQPHALCCNTVPPGHERSLFVEVSLSIETPRRTPPLISRARPTRQTGSDRSQCHPAVCGCSTTKGTIFCAPPTRTYWYSGSARSGHSCGVSLVRLQQPRPLQPSHFSCRAARATNGSDGCPCLSYLS